MSFTSQEADAIATEFKEYAYSVSHDLSAPVRAMVEFSKLLTNEHAKALNDETKEYLSIIIGNGQKLQGMMSGLLQYSRLNTMAQGFAETRVNKVIDDCCAMMEKQITNSHAVLKIGELPTVTADAEQLTQLFCVLIDNAIKFQPAGNTPHISISASKQDTYWQFAVRDNGIGIAPEFHCKIFKLFQRLHTDEEYPGVGFGLTLAQKVVQRHGGKIWVESTQNHGSAFYFTLQNWKERIYILTKS